ncbi:hypothetical protein [Marimonas arenosa]|uniref:Ferrochelatase n=1 Tax=Marimonas arenosa TaxID=1795305 RepID=A0AAE4B4S3_9RHOB|nr:hypothetical protein [Marimonas arenosa]MDQ2088401.1 hypothetical protein [Marimonas arenosa]
MKKSVLGLTLAALTTTTATAGSLNDPIIEQDLVTTEAAASSAPSAVAVLAIMTAVMILAATAD